MATPDATILRIRDLTGASAILDTDTLAIDKAALATTDPFQKVTVLQLKNAIKGYRTQVVIPSADVKQLLATPYTILAASGDADIVRVIDSVYALIVGQTTGYSSMGTSPHPPIIIGQVVGGAFPRHELCIPSEVLNSSVPYKAFHNVAFTTLAEINNFVANKAYSVKLDPTETAEWDGGDGDLVLLIDWHEEDLNDFATP